MRLSVAYASPCLCRKLLDAVGTAVDVGVDVVDTLGAPERLSLIILLLRASVANKPHSWTVKSIHFHLIPSTQSLVPSLASALLLLSRELSLSLSPPFHSSFPLTMTTTEKEWRKESE